MSRVNESEMAEKRAHPVTSRFKICEDALNRVCTFQSIITILREIDNINIALWMHESTEDQAYSELCAQSKTLCQLLLKIFWTSKDLNFHQKIIKAAMKPALCMNYLQIELLLDRYAMVVSKVGAECLKTYAWFQNSNFAKTAGVFMCNTIDYHDNFVQTSLKYSADSRYFALAIENYISAYDIGQTKECNEFTFTVILTNLENAHRNVRPLLFELFKRMMKCFDEAARKRSSIIQDILHLSWTNRNKYQLLAIIISTDCDILLKHKDYNTKRFHEGIQVGLTMHNLYAPSQTLVKVMMKNEVFHDRLIGTTIDILWGDDDLLAGNLINFWLSTYERKICDKIYDIMNAQARFRDLRSTSSKYRRLLLLHNTFRKSFQCDEIASHALFHSKLIEDLPTKIEVFRIMVDKALSEPVEHVQLTAIILLFEFLAKNIATKESSFVDQYIMRRLPEIFNLLATRKLRKIERLTQIFIMIRIQIFDHGLSLGSYESITFSLKFLNVILKQYFGSSGNRLTKNTYVKGNIAFGKHLAESKIWDIRSVTTFKKLLKLMEEDEHSDLSDLALNILVDYFIRSSIFEKMTIEDEPFVDYIKRVVARNLTDPEISSNVKAKRYFVLKFECSLVLKTDFQELLSAADLLKTQFMTIYRESDPVKSMEQGLHLFKLMDSINYGLKQVNPEAVKSSLIPVLNVLLKNIALHFMNFLCDEKIPPSFELMDKKLCELLDKTKVQNAAELKPKLVFYIWYTLRSSSDISSTLASIVTKNFDHESKEFNQVMNTCLDVNIQILTRCCHKGVIDSACNAIGEIAKMISDEYSNLSLRTVENTKYLHSFLVTLKKEIFANKRPPSTSGDIRSSRGLVVMAHKIISSRPPFLKFLMDSLLVTVKIQSFEDTKSIRFHENVKPIQLHLLAALVKDGELAEDMLKYLDFVLLATFKAYKLATDYIEINALLQIIGSIVPKIANQKRYILSDEPDSPVSYEPKSVTCYEFYVKFTYSFRIALFDLDESNIGSLSAMYIIILLEILSNFEYRNNVEIWSEIERMRDVFQRLMSHKVEKIRLLASKCFAQWHEVLNLGEVITDQIEDLFSRDSNVVHSSVICIRLMVQRYESCLKGVVHLDMTVVKEDLRKKISEKFDVFGFPGATTFFLRQHLLDFLLFLGFAFEGPICQSLLNEASLLNDDPEQVVLEHHGIGYKMWADKVKNLQDKK